jgi:hypothetical protein
MKIGKYVDIMGGFPASGPLRGTEGHGGFISQGKRIFSLVLLIRCGRPVGGGGVHPNRGYGGLNPHQNSGIHRFSWEIT